MIVSRGYNAVKLLSRISKSLSSKGLQPIRHSHDHHEWLYRARVPEFPKSETILATAFSSFAWWWILWHCFTEPGHLIGEYHPPDTSLWTDEELGIPPDDEEPDYL